MTLFTNGSSPDFAPIVAGENNRVGGGERARGTAQHSALEGLLPRRTGLSQGLRRRNAPRAR